LRLHNLLTNSDVIKELVVESYHYIPYPGDNLKAKDNQDLKSQSDCFDD